MSLGNTKLLFGSNVETSKSAPDDPIRLPFHDLKQLPKGAERPAACSWAGEYPIAWRYVKLAIGFQSGLGIFPGLEWLEVMEI